MKQIKSKIFIKELKNDHRLIDGREAVTFLATIKDCIENPGRFLLEL